MELYDYWRSTSSYRLRIALAWKGVAVLQHPVHLVRDGGEQRMPAYRALNPQGRVPTLILDDGVVLTQSPAIIEYLEEQYPEPPLLPSSTVERARVRAVASTIACDIHPLHNVSVLNMLRKEHARSDIEVAAWITSWITDGFAAIETLIADEGFCFGGTLTLADVYLVPQVYAARRFGVKLDAFPRILRASTLAESLPAVQSSHPDRQADAA